MRMSKSIKDYKDAMDNIKISDSFYKRTENLLGELDQVKIEKKSSFGGGRVTAGIMAAAACIVCVIGLKIALDGGESGIDTASPETVIEITEESAPALIDAPEREDGHFAGLDEPASSGDDTLDGGGIAVASDMDESAGAPESDDEEEKKLSTISIDAEGGAETSAPVTSMTAVPAGSAAPTQEGAYTGGEGYPDVTVRGYENIPMMDDISLENVTVEVTPYFDMGGIKSGEGAVKKSGTELASVIDFIASVAASATEIENDSFRSVFTMRIADENIGVTFYSIYLTDSDTLVITKHSTDIQQRVTYLLNKDDCEALRHALFLMFGEETDYRLFESLISGK